MTYRTQISGLTILGLIFVGMKLSGAVDWSWWIITLPFWGLYALCALSAVLGFLAYIALAAIVLLVGGASALVLVAWEWFDSRR